MITVRHLILKTCLIFNILNMDSRCNQSFPFNFPSELFLAHICYCTHKTHQKVSKYSLAVIQLIYNYITLTFLSLSPDTVSMYCSWIMKAAKLAVQLARKMTAKKAQTRTIILLVVPLGFSIGTELLKTIPHRSQTDFPMVKVGPPGAIREVH